MTKRYIEHETVVLLGDHHESGLQAGDVGAIVHVYENGEAYDVEFTRADGQPVAILTLRADEIRHLGTQDLLHVRQLTSSEESRI